ncbi:MAG: hypothetical protein U0572_05200 [Phycisphaerales bacterium]
MTGREIERVWVLARMPAVPAHAERWEIEQGYLPEPRPGHVSASGAAPDFAEGRIRRIVMPDGRVVCRHTVKRGSGLIREETERDIDAAEFDRAWPLTKGRRIVKTRFRVREADLVWEVDCFQDLPLVMLEVELPSETTSAPLPPWLAPLVEREVTEDPRYRNAALAIEGLPR